MTDKVTVPVLSGQKRHRGDPPIVMVTAYDTPSARAVDAAGVDAILVGDSVADNVLGLDSTLRVTVDEMRHHVAAVARARPNALIIADLPWMSYHVDVPDALRNAAMLIRAGAEAVKLEGGRRRLPVVHALLDAEIPVMGHLGLTPQSVNTLGGLRVQGRDLESATTIELDAKALAEAGCFGIVLEGIPEILAARITEAIGVPTIGIGAGSSCDGQVLVLHDIIGLGERPAPKFARKYADVSSVIQSAVAAYAADVRSGDFPDDSEAYHGTQALREALSRRQDDLR
jgi:3-methyl-2-oxobutanoate hydroxymethyltransferase